MQAGATAGLIAAAIVNDAWANLGTETGTNAALAAIVVKNQVGATPSLIVTAGAAVEVIVSGVSATVASSVGAAAAFAYTASASL
jgi:putative flippase GtrA